MSPSTHINIETHYGCDSVAPTPEVRERRSDALEKAVLLAIVCDGFADSLEPITMQIIKSSVGGKNSTKYVSSKAAVRTDTAPIDAIAPGAYICTATPAGRTCANTMCNTMSTPMWRVWEDAWYCNACGECQCMPGQTQLYFATASTACWQASVHNTATAARRVACLQTCIRTAVLSLQRHVMAGK
jgi:hypothetical protein